MLGLQALLLMEKCIHTQMLALATAQAACLSSDALEDLVSAVELYNQVVMYHTSQQKAASWSLHIRLSSGSPRTSARPLTFSLREIMRILAQKQSHVVSEKLHGWVREQLELESLAAKPSTSWEDLNRHTSSQATPSDAAQESPKTTSRKASSLTLVLLSHHESLEMFLQALASSADLTASHISKTPSSERTDVKLCRPLHRNDLNMTDTCSQLYSQYCKIYWTEFPNTFMKYFYYQFNGGVLGGVNQWNYQMVFLLVKWLRDTGNQGTLIKVW